MKSLFSLLATGALVLLPQRLGAQANATGIDWQYRLLEGSTLVDDCLICARPTILQPMRGSFRLVLIENTPLFSRYALRDVSFLAGSPTNEAYSVVGAGTYQIGGEVAVLQDMTLQVVLSDPNNVTTNKEFTNDVRTIDRAWPIIDVHLVQTDNNLVHYYSVHLLAAPLREIWFSTGGGFTASKWQSPTNRVSPGDLISDSGRIVCSNSRLLGKLGLTPVVPDLGIDAVDIGPGGKVFFSLNEAVFSETLGPIQHGDLLSDRGTIFRKNEALLAAFAPQSTGIDYGLDAVQVMTDSTIYFSTTTNVITSKGMLFRGDVLSNEGKLIKSNQQLLARFHPPVVDHDYGLDALYIWPGGEIWFSTEEGFNDSQLGPILAGDVLSDQGYVVYHNLELVSAFAPIEDVADFGLDALYIVTDTIPPPPIPKISSVIGSSPVGDLSLNWTGSGRVFQLEKATIATGPFAPISPLMVDLNWLDSRATQSYSNGFYRLRQW